MSDHRHQPGTSQGARSPGAVIVTDPTAGRGLLRDLLRSTPGARIRLGFAVVLAACAAAASIGLLGTSGWLIARAAEMPPLMYLNVAIVGVRFFGISRSCVRYIERLVGHHVAFQLQSALRMRTYATLSRTTLLGRRRGDLLARVVTDVDAIVDLVVRVVLPFASASVVAVGTSVVLARFSPLNALLLLASALLAGGIAPWLAARLSRQADAAAAPARGLLATRAHELARSAVDLVAYDAADRARADLLAVDAQLRRVELRSAWVRGLATALQTMAAGAAVITALVLGGQEAAAGNLPPRMIAVLALIPLALHETLADLTAAAQTLTRTRSSLARVGEVLRAEPVGTGDAPQEPASGSVGVSARGLALAWPGGPTLATGLEFQAGPGDRLVVTGRSGAGKTTLAATLMGFIPPDAGQIEVRGRVGYLAQDAHIFATSVAENVRIGRRDASAADVAAALRRAGLDHLDPDRIVGEGGQSLSGGEARRVALARLLVRDVDVWILDEPSEHLDAATADALMRDVWESAHDCPVIVFTHDPAIRAVETHTLSLG